MILRAIRGRGNPARLEALRGALGELVRTLDTAAPGLSRVHFGTRGEPAHVEVIALGCWDSAEAAAAADARSASPLALARLHLHDVTVQHFELDEGVIRRSTEQPVAIRLATGRFSKPGADAEMQDMLRRRAPNVGDDMLEAYVGRRLDDRAVEVTFVSTWRRIPADQPLEAAFWPDIALRYDTFSVEVYRAMSVESA